MTLKSCAHKDAQSPSKEDSEIIFSTDYRKRPKSMVPTPANALPPELEVPYRQSFSMMLGVPEDAGATQIHESIAQGFPAMLLSALCEKAM